jgi:phosphomannomutase/phosphoglucomutase
MSGHVFFADRYFGYDDAVYAGARLIEILAKSGKKLSSILADLPRTVFTPELRVDCPDEIKFQLADQARDRFRDLGYDLIDVDGVRIRFDKGWGLIRASNTQPALVMRFEASDQTVLDQYRRIVEGELDSLKARLTQAA